MEEDDDGSRVVHQVQHSNLIDNIPLPLNNQQHQLEDILDVSNKEAAQCLDDVENTQLPSSSSFDTQLPQIHNQVDIFKQDEKLPEMNEQPSFSAQSEFHNSNNLVQDSLSVPVPVPVHHTDAVIEEEPSLPPTVIEVAAPILPQETPPTNIPDVASNDSHAEDPPCNTLSMSSEQVPSTIAEDLPSTVIENVHSPCDEGASIDESLVVSEEAPSIVAADLPSVADENAPEAPSMIAQETFIAVTDEAGMSPIHVPEDNPSMADEDINVQAAPSVSAEVAALDGVAEEGNAGNAEDTKDTVSMVTEDAPPVLAENIPPVSAEEPLPLTAEVATEMIAEEMVIKVSETASPMVVDNASPMSEKDASPEVKEDASLEVKEDASQRVSEDAPPIDDENASSEVKEDASQRVSEDAPPIDDENASSIAADEAAHVSDGDTEMEVETEMETEVVETGSSGGRKRKRGRPAKVQAKAPASRRTEEEDVCFICFDGGNLVLCDRRGCPKAYHPSCVNRDEAFFRSKGRWNCGWHICSNCEKSAQYMCYTCTYSLCKGCVKESEFLCVRGNRGFCETCMRTVMLIEKNEQAQVDFDDKSSWEYLFKEYWTELKKKVSLTLDELTQAKNPFKGSNTSTHKGESSEELYDANDTKDSDSEDSSSLLELSNSKRRKPKRRSKSSKEEPPSVTTAVSGVTDAVGEGKSLSNNTEWASKELLELVAHMRNGDKSVLSQYDVQALLLDYIKLNKLRDPQRKSQIVCDSRLMNLFGKARVGHFEMLKLLESHFLIKEDVHAEDVNGDTTDMEANKMDGDGNAGVSTKASSDKRRKSRKKGDGRGPQTNLDDYAAVDVHNIKLLYLRRNLMEDLLEDGDKFHENVVGSFVRIRISGAGQKQDMYRLVQVVGTRKAAEPYKTGKRLADVVLEILNLNKSEVIAIDTISNQDFSEDECKRLRQSIKCGLISRMTVGEVQEKALTLQAVRVNDWLEMEKMRISHLRDRASEQGRRKDLRECVEKLQLLNTPEERSRRLQEIPEVHADPNMDPNYESEEDEEQDDRPQDKAMTARDTGFSRKGREPISPGKGSPASVDTWSGARRSVTTGPEPVRNMSTVGVWDSGYGANGVGESVSSDARHLNSGEIPKNLASATGLVTGASSGQAGGRSGPSGNLQEPVAPLSTSMSSNISETEKMWHYQDPSGKIQGPFSMVQLRKWSTTGHFPVDLRIWRTTEKQEDSILLTNALVGRFNKELPPKGNSFSPPEKVAALSGNNQVNLGSGWEVSTNTPWTDKSQTERTASSNWKDASGWEGSTNTSWTDKSQIERVSNSNWKDGSGWDGSTDTVRTDRNHIDRAMNSNWKDASGFANGSTQLANSDGWSSGSSNWPAQTTDPKREHSGYSSRGSWNSRGGNAWPGRTIHSPHSYSGQQHHRPTSHQGGQSGGRWSQGPNRGNNWSSGRYRAHSDGGRGYDKRANNMGHLGQSSGDNWRVPPETSSKGWGSWNTVETPKPATDGWDFNPGNRNNSSNLPSPTPKTGRGNPTEQASGNRWSPTPVSSFPANTLPSMTSPRMGSNGAQLSPIRTVELNKSGSGWNEQQQFGGIPSGGLGPAFVPNKPAEILNQDGRGNYPSPTPTPTPTPHQ